MDDVTYAAVWPNGTTSQLGPQNYNPQASDWTDVLMYGLSHAASNAAWNLSNSVGNPPQYGPSIGVTVGTSGNLMPLLILGGLAYLLFSKG
ncbi:hypothetical protein [Herbaspirillum aquaticum]|uniref:hypothetical protein n=1 Tax=Herbaspirillum aquaticum TaxID=568783 RepID=UPI0024DE3B02|nr:hypothetical protein [Herbaspirillum aquaticum]